jgi:hypothetical protein
MSKRIYKYLSARYAIDDLQRRRVKVSTIDELNDPFDLGPIDTTHPQIEKALTEMVAAFRASSGILCFSRIWDNILLWSHYGNCHAGVCLGFDIPGDQPGSGYDMEVCYQPNLLQIRSAADVTYDLVERLLRTKYEVWSYEQELRMFVKLNDPPDAGGFQWFDFGPNLELKEVIVGPQCSATDSRSVTEALKQYGDSAKCFWAYLKRDAFALIRKETPPPWLS